MGQDRDWFSGYLLGNVHPDSKRLRKLVNGHRHGRCGILPVRMRQRERLWGCGNCNGFASYAVLRLNHVGGFAIGRQGSNGHEPAVGEGKWPGLAVCQRVSRAVFPRFGLVFGLSL